MKLIAFQDLENCIDEYCKRHLTPSYERQQLLETMLQSYGSGAESLGSPLDEADPNASTSLPNSERHRLAALLREEKLIDQLLHEFEHVKDVKLNEEQQAAYDAVMAGSGITMISGVGGSGKSLLIQRLTHDLRQRGSTVLLSATTGVAAMRLSKHAVTAHSLFDIPVGRSSKKGGNKLAPMPPGSLVRKRLESMDVAFIDESAMLNSRNLNVISFRMQQALPAPMQGEALGLSGKEALAESLKKHLVLVGDHLQVL